MEGTVGGKGSMKRIGVTVMNFGVFLDGGPPLGEGIYPEKSGRILVGFTLGVAPDVSARLLADKLAEALAKPVVVENVTGAGGNIGAARVAQPAPGGYTLGMVGNGSLIFSPSLYDKLDFDPGKSCAP